ncbi:PepSY domain-containing protein [Actinoalloteichus spitiensis]|uniref:PepSY domain-containing protein n=1 Tax=Actinoalloteichus spitiensis TaxID=252394 RepID=UPI0003739240|nr:PepSY domain-containing protein [Actinoalloteichus spitiensis]
MKNPKMVAAVVGAVGLLAIGGTAMALNDGGNSETVPATSAQHWENSGNAAVNNVERDDDGDDRDDRDDWDPRSVETVEATSAEARENGPKISYEEAERIALERVPGARVTEVELDEDDGRYEWEIELRKDRMEYDIDIDAVTGDIIGYEEDRDDD